MSAPPSLRVREASRGGHTDCYLTASAPPGLSAAAAARSLYSRIGAILAAQGLEPVQEKIYGLDRERPAVLRARKSALQARGLDESLPVSYLEGRPASGAGLAGVQMWAVRTPRRVETLRHPGGWGRLWTEGPREFLYLPAITGAAPDGTWPARRADQARGMFLKARSALRRHGFEFSQVVRTWIYLRRILDWYGEFNQVRSALYRGPGFFGGRFRDLAPASTGIGGFCGRGDCVMDVLAVRGGAGVRRVRRSSRQGPAPRYGSAFSRAVVLPDGPRRTIHVSGTASIDPAGRSVGLGDPAQQSLQTLLNVAALLEENGAGLEDIGSAVLFCKDRRAHAAFLRARRLLRLPDFPVLAVLADVCRPELRIELEAVAATRR